MPRREALFLAASATVLLISGPVLAGTPDVRLLKGVRAYERDGCALVKIAFREKVTIAPVRPATGDELRVDLKTEPAAGEKAEQAGDHESLRPPAGEIAGIHAIELERGSGTNELALYFRRSVVYRVALGPDGESLIVAVAGASPGTSCEPVFDDAQPSASSGDMAAEPAGATGTNDAEQKRIDQMIGATRSALDKNDPTLALQTAEKVVEEGNEKAKQEARELVGVAYEHARQPERALSAYREYLGFYPKGQGADRVRARITALEQAAASGKAVTPPGAGIPDGPATLQGEAGKDASVTKVVLQPSTERRAWAPQPALPDPDVWTLRTFGSASVSYERNQGGRDYYFAPQLSQGWEKDRLYDIYRSSAVSSLNFEAQYSNADFAGKVRLAFMNDYRTLDGRDEFNFSTLYYDANWKSEGLSGRIGRQSRFTGGVLGRFDGALVSYKVSNSVTVNAVGGSPVERSTDEPFINDRYFYGFSTDFSPWGKDSGVTAYFVDQQSNGLIDRQAVGAEVRWADDWNSAFSSLDYDVHYSELNSVLATASHVFENRGMVSVNLDYRRSPLVFTTNALLGQTATTLSGLLGAYDIKEIEQFALDRSAQSYVASLNFSQPITDRVQYNVDLTWSYLTGTDASAGVDATSSPGPEFYAMGQVLVSDVLTDGDLYTATLRYADTDAARRYMAELSARYPVSSDWRLTPILRLGYADFSADDRVDYEIMPTLRMSYLLRKDVTVDFEAGEKWTLHHTVHGNENETELVLLTGIRYDFESGPNR